MNRRTKTMCARDSCVVRLFYNCLRERKMGTMDAYSYCAEEYDISESQVRRIVKNAQRISVIAQ